MLGHKSAILTFDLYGHLCADDLDSVAVAFDSAAREFIKPTADSLRTGSRENGQVNDFQPPDLDFHGAPSRTRTDTVRILSPEGCNLVDSGGSTYRCLTALFVHRRSDRSTPVRTQMCHSRVNENSWPDDLGRARSVPYRHGLRTQTRNSARSSTRIHRGQNLCQRTSIVRPGKITTTRSLHIGATTREHDLSIHHLRPFRADGKQSDISAPSRNPDKSQS